MSQRSVNAAGRGPETKSGKEFNSLPLLTYNARGGLRQDPIQPGESPAVARNLRTENCESLMTWAP